jgi:hypothetical protein
MEVFICVFSMYGTLFDNCLFKLNKVLQWCEDQYLLLNKEKCHFVATKEVVLRHTIVL